MSIIIIAVQIVVGGGGLVVWHVFSRSPVVVVA
jgi:hypothetical protein